MVGISPGFAAGMWFRWPAAVCPVAAFLKNNFNCSKKNRSAGRLPYQQRLLRVHSPVPTPPSRVSLPHAAAPAAGRDEMTPSVCRGQGESCCYRDMASRSRPSAAVCRSLVPRRPLQAIGRLAIAGRKWANRRHSLLPITHGDGGINTLREGV